MKFSNYIEEYHNYIERYPNRVPNTIKSRVKIDNDMLEMYNFKDEFVDKCIRWIEKYCYLVDGEKSGKVILTLPQKYVISVIFGFWGYIEEEAVNEFGEINGTKQTYQRIVKDVLLMVGSGFGKTTFVAAIIFLITTVDKVFGNQSIFIGSNTYAQSKLCYETTQKMIEKSKFNDRYRITESSGSIINKSNKNKIKAMSSKGDNHEGINPSIIFIDEVHLMKDGKYANNLKKSNKRDDILMIETTTQGDVRGGYLDSRLKFARKQLDNCTDFRTQYFLWESDSIDELVDAYNNDTIDVLFKANPNLGISQSVSSVRSQLINMVEDVSKRTYILTKIFNIPQNKESSYYTANECRSLEFDESKLVGMPCFIGLDVAFTRSPNTDLTALTFSVVDPVNDKIYHIDKFFLPKIYLDDEENEFDMVELKSKEDGIDYQYFIDRGDVILVDDNSIKNEIIIQTIKEMIIKYKFNVLKFGVDPNKADDVINTFNSITQDTKFCLPYLSERKVWTTPIIEFSKEKRAQQKVYTNNKLTEIHFANTLAKYDSNNYILLTNAQRQRKDMVIAHMAAYSAYKVWSGQINKYGISNFDTLKMSFKLEE